jgi:hypothetical protein
MSTALHSRAFVGSVLPPEHNRAFHAVTSSSGSDDFAYGSPLVNSFVRVAKMFVFVQVNVNVSLRLSVCVACPTTGQIPSPRD